MIQLRKVSRSFSSVWAVQDLSLEIKKGEIYGFLGPNGAGKTTSIRMMTGLLQPTSGEVTILGMSHTSNSTDIKRQMGLVFDEPQMFPCLSVREYLAFTSSIYRCDESEFNRESARICQSLNIDFLDKRISDLSHGMKQKAAVLSVLARRPQVLFLDEPTVGLDARAVVHLQDHLVDLAQSGSAIVITTHIMSIAEKLCSRIGIMNKGRLVAEGTMDALRSQKAGNGASETLEKIFLSLTEEESR